MIRKRGAAVNIPNRHVLVLSWCLPLNLLVWQEVAEGYCHVQKDCIVVKAILSNHLYDEAAMIHVPEMLSGVVFCCSLLQAKDGVCAGRRRHVCDHDQVSA